MITTIIIFVWLSVLSILFFIKQHKNTNFHNEVTECLDGASVALKRHNQELHAVSLFATETKDTVKKIVDLNDYIINHIKRLNKKSYPITIKQNKPVKLIKKSKRDPNKTYLSDILGDKYNG